MANYRLSPKRRCKCQYHVGVERWHGTRSGRQYHYCTCTACKAWLANYARNLYQSMKEKAENGSS